MQTMGYSAGHGARPVSLTLSAGLVALAVAGIVFAAPKVVERINLAPTIDIYQLPVPPEPKPIPETKPQPRDTARPAPLDEARPDQPEVEVWTPPIGPSFPIGEPIPPGEPVGTGGTGTGGTGTAIDPPAPPVLIEPTADPRYARDFQPLYPADERRLEREGLVIVNVLIGTDGRVKQVERISSPSDAFFETTRRQALSKWRFRPGTRGGEPIERWRRMRVNFVLTDE